MTHSVRAIQPIRGPAWLLLLIHDTIKSSIRASSLAGRTAKQEVLGPSAAPAGMSPRLLCRSELISPAPIHPPHGPMPRPKTNPTSADIDDEIARLTREQEQRIAALMERRRQAESAENLRRGQLIQSYLGGPHGAEIRRALAPVVGRRDRALFGIVEENAPGV